MTDSLINPRTNPYFRDPRIRKLLVSRKLINRYGDILRPSKSAPTISPPRRIRRDPIVEEVSDEEIKPIPRKEKHRSPSAPAKRDPRLLKRHQSASLDVSNTGQPLPLSRPVNRLHRSTSGYQVSRDFAERSARYGMSSKTNPRSKSPKKPLPRIVIKYLGQQPLLERNDRWFHQKGDEIVVMQQHNGGENLTVFKGYVKPYHTFTFDSRRHADYRFALAFYVNGLISCRVSVCCEFKHKKNALLGGPTGSFSIHDVLHSKPCENCQFERMKRRMQRKSRRLNPPKMPSYNESVVPKKPARKSRTPSPDNSESSKEGKEQPSDSTSISGPPKPPLPPPAVVRSHSPEAEEKRPGSIASTDNEPTASTKHKSNLGTLSESASVSSSDESKEDKTVAAGLKTMPFAPAKHSPTSQKSSSSSSSSSSTSVIEDTDEERPVTPKSPDHRPNLPMSQNSNGLPRPVVEDADDKRPGTAEPSSRPSNLSMNAISNRLPPTVIEDADDKRPSALNELGSAAKALTSFATHMRQKSDSEGEKKYDAELFDSDDDSDDDDTSTTQKSSQFEKPHISDTQSIDQDDDYKSSKKASNRSNSHDAAADFFTNGFSKKTSPEKKSNGHHRQDSTDSSRKSGPSDNDDELYKPSKTNGKKDMKSVQSTSTNGTSDGTKYPLKSPVPDEPLPRSSRNSPDAFESLFRSKPDSNESKNTTSSNSDTNGRIKSSALSKKTRDEIDAFFEDDCM